jgi:putative transposase
MAILMVNAAFRIHDQGLDGLYRVVAIPPGSEHAWLGFIGPGEDSAGDENGSRKTPLAPGSVVRVSTSLMKELEQAGAATDVEMHAAGHRLRPELLDGRQRTIWERRCALAKPFLNHTALCNALEETGGLGPVIKLALLTEACSRASAYRVWELLCVRGFDVSSLVPDFALCGAPGVRRPISKSARKAGAKTFCERIGGVEPHPQRGVTAQDRIKIAFQYKALMRPGMAFQKIYVQIIQRLYVSSYRQTPKGLEPVLPEQGTYPNQRQARYIVETELKAVERRRLRTTEGHFNRNHRGLVGRMYDNVYGPGVAYAIDSTVGDVFLRSSINRAWFVGRPVVYFVVDIWSTAIVGFYLCLTGPSWDTAKLALFSVAADSQMLAELWGGDAASVLNPHPTLPRSLWCDRGEYLSLGARETGTLLLFDPSYNPAYRPDYKGMVEVVHRIEKDEQFCLIPGAFDARRKELELKSQYRDAGLTIREYARYLQCCINYYNATADRRHRLTAEMIAVGVHPSPAGLWRFGHEAGMGYLKLTPQEQLMRALLAKKQAVSRRDGVFMESLHYESETAHAEEWSAMARNFGSKALEAYHFPGSTSRIWLPDANCRLQEFRIRPNARAPEDLTLDDWRDALATSKGQHSPSDLERQRLEFALSFRSQTENMVRAAQAKNLAAEERDAQQAPAIRDARRMEMLQPLSKPLGQEPESPPPQSAGGPLLQHQKMLDEFFAELNRKAAGGTR